jgi:hypothetical protein
MAQRDLEPGFTVDRHGGLQLNEPDAQVGPEYALDLLDVDWDAQGVLGSRMGTEKVASPETSYDTIYGAAVDFDPRGEEYALLARREHTLVVIDEAGAEGASLEVGGNGLSFAQIGLGVLRPVTYIASLEHPVRKFADGEFSEPTATIDGEAGKAMPEAGLITTWPDGGNRLVFVGTGLSGGPGGADSSPNTIWFSEPGQPESFESTAFVELDPGDGEQIVDCASWGRQVFVLKERHLIVFYGISADEEGKPIFNFRTIDLGTRARGGCAVGREGVYFLAEDGVWVTTGGRPALVSDMMNLSQFRRDRRTTLGGITFPSWNIAKGIVYLDECIYVGLLEEEGAGPAIERLLKIDLETGRATLWKTNILDFIVWSPTWAGVPRLVFSGGGEKKGVYLFTPETDKDVVVEMDPYWCSGRYDLSDPDEKTLTITKIWGSGDVDVSTAEDYGAYGATKTFSLGEGDAIAQRQLQRGQTATLLSHRLSGAAPWSVQRITRYLQSSRVSATEKAA